MRATHAAVMVCTLCLSAEGRAAFVIPVDIDGSSTPATGTYNPLFRTTNGTGNPAFSNPSTAPGMPAGNSVFGGASATRDTYEYLYTPGTNTDNVTFTAGQDLGNGNAATGLTGGGAGIYAAYVTWTPSTNASLSPTTFEIIGPGDTVLASSQAVLRDAPAGITGNTWFRVGTALLSPGAQYIVRQTAPDSSFVSTRSAGAMFELVTPAAVPEPSSLLLLSFCGAVAGGTAWRKRRRSAG